MVDEQSQALTAQGAELDVDDAEAAALELEAHMRATMALIARFHTHAEQWEALEVGTGVSLIRLRQDWSAGTRMWTCARPDHGAFVLMHLN